MPAPGSPPARERSPLASWLSPVLRLELVPDSRAPTFSLQSHFLPQLSSPSPLPQAMAAPRSACGTRLGGGVIPGGAGLWSLAAPRPTKFPTRLPLTNHPRAFAAGVQVHGRAGTAAGRGQPQRGAEATSTVDTRVARRTGAWSRPCRDTHTRIPRHRGRRGLRPPRQLLVVSPKGSFICQDAQKR